MDFTAYIQTGMAHKLTVFENLIAKKLNGFQNQNTDVV